MNTRRKSLSHNLINLYGEDGKRYSKKLQKSLCKDAKLRNQLIFLRRCRDNEVVPKGLMPSTTLKSSKAQRIMKQAGLSLVKATINEYRQQLHGTKIETSKCKKWLKDNMNDRDASNIERVAKVAANKTYARVKQEHLQKYAKLQKEQTPVSFLRRNTRSKGSFPMNTVRNESSKVLSDAEISILSKGMNFAPTPTQIPVKDIIAATEYGIREIEEGEANLVRSDVLRVLKQAKAPQPNITRDEMDALSSLKNDDSIIVLPADKGRSTVVLDKEKIRFGQPFEGKSPCTRVILRIFDHSQPSI